MNFLIEEKKRLDKVKQEEAIEKYFLDPEFRITRHKIIIADSKKMCEVVDSSIELIVTSPPYFNAKKYSNWKSLKEYLQDMKSVFTECYRVLKPGRKFCLNISDLPEKGNSGVRWIPLGAELLKICLDVGFELSDRIFWFKTPIKGFNYGSLPYPASPLICDSMEYIYILRKPGKIDYTGLSKKQKEASRLKRSEYAEYTKQFWSIRRVRELENINGHIAPFPDELVHRCIKLYSFVGETVLDPFGGSGTTTKMSMINRRNSVLYEIKKEYLRLIKEKINYSQKRLEENEIVIFNDRA